MGFDETLRGRYNEKHEIKERASDAKIIIGFDGIKRNATICSALQRSMGKDSIKTPHLG